MREIRKTPESLVSLNGEPELGFFERPFKALHLDRAQAGLWPGAKLWRRFRTKEWVGFGIVHPDFYLSTMISNTKYLASGVVYLVDRRSGTLYEYEEPGLPFLVPVAGSTYGGVCRFSGLRIKLEFRFDLEAGRHRLSFDVAGRKDAPAIKGELNLRQDFAECAPLVASLPVVPKHHTYTNKALMPTSGELRIGTETIRYLPERDLANLDEQKGYYPYVTKWRWASCAGHDEKGRILGLNIADHQFENPSVYNENALWAAGELERLGAATLEFDEKAPLDPWTIRDADGQVDLRFMSEGRKRVNYQFGVIKIDYFQAFGRFSGLLRRADGTVLNYDSLYGVAERMFMRS